MTQEQTLALMGITQWHARYQLPNAVNLAPVESQSTRNKTVEQVVQPSDAAVQNMDTQTVQPAAVAVIPSAPRVQKPSTEAISAKPESIAPSEAMGPPVRFELMMYRTENLVLIDSMPDKNDAARREFAQKLAANILSSQPVKQASLKSVALAWPLFDHPNAPKDAESAQAYVENKLAMLTSDVKPALVVCAGNQAERYCLGKQLKPGDVVDHSEQKFLVSYSLSQLLNSGAMKSEFYDHLRQALSSEQ